MTAMEPDNTSSTPEERIAIIADAIAKAYGDNAILVARRQLDAADDDSRADWLAVLDHLRRD